MSEIIKLFPVLAVAVAMNTAAGTYYNIDVLNCRFDREKLLKGILKAVLVCGMFVGTAYCFDAIDLSAIGATPPAIMNAAIILYVGKAVTSLGKILGIPIPGKDEVPS